MGFGVVRSELYGALELANGARELPGLEVHQAQVDAQRGVGGVLANQALVNLSSAVKMPELEVGQSEEILSLLVVRLELVGRFQLRPRVFQLPGLQQLAAAVEQG